MTYDQVRQKVNTYQSEAQSWRSDRETLQKIIDAAEIMGIEPEWFNKLSISHLREICPSAGKAARDGDKEEMERILQLATKFTVTDLRIELNKAVRERIAVRKTTLDGTECYAVYLSADQLAKIQHTVKRKFDFVLD